MIDFDQFDDVSELPRPFLGYYTFKNGAIVLCKNDDGHYVVWIGHKGRVRMWDGPLKKKTAWARFIAEVADRIEKKANR